jgi:hypothetical protein
MARRDLSRSECLDHLRCGSFGRVAVTVGALPHIAAVHYYVIGETIFLESPGSNLHGKLDGSVIAFECGTSDAPAPLRCWSVCAVGVATPVDEVLGTGPIVRLHPELLHGWEEWTTPPEPALNR